ncbi:MarR family transcriptional regulator [Modestobacter sp. VKM Ac-2986]|uniref:MarR family winged helix-turn-helix transcriptional regulator n=1 Tax=Modestobacter sp. VKM Ac-2986 TaxID=3004140 RepID=UPI0022AA7796|nr:MarR family transcriptional regulator [Modestobacter sp. VKM Ac-2986]MCZ2828848.1 MarR family transcriptional regulator [Modestobacter sp. VKM Ac-2986]
MPSASAVDPDRAPRAAASRVEYVSQRLARALTRATELVVARHSISVPEYRMLLLLSDQVPRSNAELARLMFVSSQATHLVLSDLVARGLVGRSAHPGNRRVRLARPTELGTVTLNACLADMIGIEDRILAGMPPAERGMLLSALQHAAEVLAGGYFGDEDLEREAVALRRHRS